MKFFKLGKGIVFLLMLLAQGYLLAAELTHENYEFYQADYNDDGLMDIVLVPKQKILIIASGVDFPVDYSESALVFIQQGDGSYISLYPADIQVINGLNLLDLEYELYAADFDGDGVLDMLFQSPDNDASTFIGYSDKLGRPIKNIATLGGSGLSRLAGDISITDLQGDGIADIQFVSNMGSTTVFYGVYNGAVSTEYALTSSRYPGAEMAPLLEGGFQVSESGAATYSLSFDIPSVPSGLVPDFGIAYSSSAGNGELGIGWMLTGESSVTRCPTDLTNDDFEDPVDFDDNDQFCLDGERLLLVSGAHFQLGAEYRLSSNPVQRITLVSTSASGTPIAFEVESGKGSKTYYGSTQDSRFMRSDGEVFEWSIVTSVDAFGNEVNYHYNSNKDQGDHHIDYATYGDAQEYMIEFLYEARPDVLAYYIAPGLRRSIPNRLAHVKVSSGARDYRRYNFVFGASASGESYLAGAALCNSINNECSEPLEFSWVNSGAGYDTNSAITAATVSTPISTNIDWAEFDTSQVTLMDFNGDGYTDIYAKYRSEYVTNWKSHWINYSNGDGTFTTEYLEITRSSTDQMTIQDFIFYDSKKEGNYDASQKYGDFDGDGKLEILRLKEPSSTYSTFQTHILKIVPGGKLEVHDVAGFDFSFRSDLNWAKVDIQRVTIADFDGDGLSDVYEAGKQGILKGDYISFSNGDNTFRTQWIMFGPRSTISTNLDWARIDTQRLKFADFNGDGKTDIYQIHNGQDQIHFSNGDATFETIQVTDLNAPVSSDVSWASVDVNRITTADFNGDGLADIYQINNGLDNVYLSRGDGTFERKNGIDSTIGSIDFAGNDLARVKIVDINADGRDDIYYVRGNGGTATDKIYLAKEDGSFSAEETYVRNGLDSNVRSNDRWMSVDISRIKFADFDGDGTQDIFYQNATNPDLYYNTVKRPLITAFPAGTDTSIQVNYEHLTQSDHYTSGSPADDVDQDGLPDGYPVQQVTASPMLLVTSTTTENGAGGEQVNEFFYEGLKSHITQYGSLGFSKQVSVDTTTGITSTSEYSQNYQNHTAGMVTRTESRYIKNDENKLMDQTENVNAVQEVTFGNHVIRMPYLDEQMVTTWDFSTGNEKGTVVTDYEYLPDGNLQSTIMITTDPYTGDVFRSEKYMTYEPVRDYPHYLVGLVKDMTAINTVPNQDNTGTITSTRKTAFTYYDNGSPHTQTIEPGHAKALTSTFEYNSRGQVTFTTTSAAGMQNRVTEARYYADGREFKQINALDHEVTTYYENEDYPWLATRVVDPNGLAVRTVYDDWGRATTSIAPDNSSATSSMRWCDANCTEESEVYYSESSASIGMPSWSFFDKYGREVRSTHYGFAEGTPTKIHQRTLYNGLGKVAKVSDPYFDGESNLLWTETGYDDIGRMLVSYESSGNLVTMLYVGNQVISSRSNQNELAQQKIVEHNALGQLVKATDNIGGTIEYAYDAQGKLIYTKDPLGSITRAEFDVFGNKKFTEDPNKGTWSYEYDAYGQMVQQTDARGIVTYNIYDVAGRITTRIDDYQGANQETTSWYYDTAFMGATGRRAQGMLQRVEKPGFVETYQYDNLGRSIGSTTSIDGVDYTATTVYDSQTGLVDTVTYPGGGLVLKNHYHPQLGALTKVSDNSTGKAYWTLQETNVQGKATLFKLGEGIITSRSFNDQTGFLESINTYVQGQVNSIQDMSFLFDGIGNLKEKHDYVQNTHLYVDSYDGLNRMESVRMVTPLQTVTQNMTYDALGNILTKSDVGNYQYGATTQYQSLCGNDFAGPQAVTYIQNGASSKQYCYDANGNMTSGDGRELIYGSNEKPITMIKGSNRVDFYYGPSGTRYKRIDTAASVTTTTHYVGAYEKVVTGSVTTHKYQIGNYAIVTKESTKTQPETHFLLHDHQGSTVARVDSTGNQIERMNYDPWGQRVTVNIESLTPQDITQMKLGIFNRGYTGHEHIDSMGLIHMNGRVFDPVIARFVSADPFVQDATNTQALNRYAYVQNNPLSYTDPSGYFSLSKAWKKVKKAVKKVVREIKRVVKQVVKLHAEVALAIGVGGRPGLKFMAKQLSRNKYGAAIAQTVGCIMAGPGCPAVVGVITMAMSYGATGDLTSALKAGASAAAIAWASAGISNQIHAISAGIKSVVVGKVMNVAMHGALSGAASVASGGKFKSGFVSGAAGAAASNLLSDGFNADKSTKWTDTGLALGKAGRTAVSSIAGALGAKYSGGDAAAGAVQAAVQHLFNAEWKVDSGDGPCNEACVESTYQTAEGRLGEAAGAPSLGEYHHTTREEWSNMVGVGIAAVTLPLDLAFMTVVGLATIPYMIYPSTDNAIGVMMGGLGAGGRFLDEGFFYGQKVVEGTVDNIGYAIDAKGACETMGGCK